MTDTDDLLDRLTEICLALPGTARELHGLHAGYLVGKKKFAWLLNDHHGDGIVALSCRLPTGENYELAAMFPQRYYLPAYMAHHGWTALRLDSGEVDWDEVRDLVTASYRLQAPKRLSALVS